MAKFIDKFPFGCCDSSGLICPVTGVTGQITGIAAAMQQARDDKNKAGEDSCEEYVKLDGDDKIFGHKEFLDDITIRGDLSVLGKMTVSDIVDVTSETGDIQGYVFRGSKAYFDEITVGSIIKSGDYDVEPINDNSGPIFITEVTSPDSVAEILDSAFGGKIIKKVRTVSNELNVKILFERGDSQNYIPEIKWFDASNDDDKNSINVLDVKEHENGYSFFSEINLDSSKSRTFVFSNGSRLASLDIEKASKPKINSLKFINLDGKESMYGEAVFESRSGEVTVAQTEAKSGDVARLLLNCSVRPKYIHVSGNHFKKQTFSDFIVTTVNEGDGVESFDIELDALVETDTLEVKNVKASIVITDVVGNDSDLRRTGNNLLVNNEKPYASISTSYPNNNNLINNTDDIVEVNVGAGDYEFYRFEISEVLNLVESPDDIQSGSFKLSGSNASYSTSGLFTLVLIKKSNGKVANIISEPINVQAFGSAPVLSFSKNKFASSPEPQEVTITSSEALESINFLDFDVEGVSISELVKISNNEFSFNITVLDSTPRGDLSIGLTSNKVISEEFDQFFDLKISGFSERTLTALAARYEPVDIGVSVFDVSKLEVSVTPVGGNTFTVDYDSSITGARQDGASPFEAAFGIIDGNKIVIDNQIITNAGNIKDVLIKIKERA